MVHEIGLLPKRSNTSHKLARLTRSLRRSCSRVVAKLDLAIRHRNLDPPVLPRASAVLPFTIGLVFPKPFLLTIPAGTPACTR